MNSFAPASEKIRSRDGTRIAYWRTGEGPPLVLVHGTGVDHRRWQLLVSRLEPHATVYAVDRRGRGASGDADDYAVSREFEDVAVVVDAVAAVSGTAVDVVGHSFGAVCALGGIQLTTNVRRLLLYEPWAEPDMSIAPPRFAERMDKLLAAGDRERLLEAFMREGLGISGEAFHAHRSSPAWSGSLAATHTIGREARAEADRSLDLATLSAITVPTLLLLGDESPGWVKADTAVIATALPHARIEVLRGHGHMADILAPELVAQRVVGFLYDDAHAEEPGPHPPD